jgi:two-component system, NarL family, response regulator NreC
MNTGSIKIILADDHRLMREGLRSLLEYQSGMEIIAEADNGRSAVKLAREFKPDVVVMDVSMPDLNGIEATRQVKKEACSVKVLGLSMHADKHFITEMLKAGASGYLLKHCAFDELGHAIRSVSNGQIYLSPAITGVVIQDYIHTAHNNGIQCSANDPALTSREREVLQLLAEGKSTRDIADCLNLSVKTIETHRQNIMDKLQLYSIAELTKYAIVEGLTELKCITAQFSNKNGNGCKTNISALR